MVVGLIGYILWSYRDDGKENGQYNTIAGYISLGLYTDNGKKMENAILGYIGSKCTYAFHDATVMIMMINTFPGCRRGAVLHSSWHASWPAVERVN